jgi:BNR repeat-containing family member
VWSGHPVAFSLVTTGDQQLAAFYDANRQMTVAQRTLGSATWNQVTLATTLGWDSHNYVTMAVDSGGFIHLSGNMHGVPLIYFRTTRPLDVTSFGRVPSMVGAGADEQSCTYPQFFQSPSGALAFAYRDGASGNGNYIFNIYDTGTRAWTRLLNTPLLDGEGLRSAYPVGPILGPDGWYHIVWVWRETPDAATNHDLSYAKSADLVSWQTASGRALTLPITLATGDIVDAVPQMGGIINNNTKIGFDAANRPIVAYHKYVADGSTQLFNARFENGAWVPHQASAWSYRWMFGGTGTLVFDIEVEPVQLQPGGTLTQEWYNAHEGGWGAFRLDATTLAATATIDPPLPYPTALGTVESATPGMVVRWAADTSAGPDPGLLYMLRWETLESNRDMPLPAGTPIPAPTRLRLYGVRQPR